MRLKFNDLPQLMFSIDENHKWKAKHKVHRLGSKHTITSKVYDCGVLSSQFLGCEPPAIVKHLSGSCQSVFRQSRSCNEVIRL